MDSTATIRRKYEDKAVPKERIFVDTSFLVELAACSQPRSSPLVESAPNTFFSLTDNGNPEFYWSPAVLQEFVHTCGFYLFRFYKNPDKYPDVNGTNKQLYTEIGLRIRPEVYPEIASDLGKNHASPRFIAAVYDLIKIKSWQFLQHFKLTEDGLVNIEEFERLLEFKTLQPNDCLIALAARKADVQKLLTIDSGFKRTGVNWKADYGFDIHP